MNQFILCIDVCSVLHKTKSIYTLGKTLSVTLDETKEEFTATSLNLWPFCFHSVNQPSHGYIKLMFFGYGRLLYKLLQSSNAVWTIVSVLFYNHKI